ncbi:hypothetical protein ACNAW0_17755 [Micromonospora sp. SL1-18]|uniref:hypothetical protein n=1 Tax=Micromonospora sp. SL1-18 TaxID=3399128 RepID=UPI003A4DA2AF
MAVTVAVILAVVAVVAWRWWHNHPPYGPEALAVKSSLSFVSNDEAQAALGDKAHAPFASGRDQLVLGRVSWHFGDNEWQSNGNRLSGADEKASPLTFVALFPYLEEPDWELMVATAPVAMSDLLLALVYMGPDEQVYWAQRLQG